MTWNISTVAAVCVCAAAIYVFFFSFTKFSRFMLRFVLRGTLGLGVLSVFNALAAAYSLCIGLNIYTFAFCGVLGLPGYILLLGTRLLF
ncbi:MAG: pro-sigmaK processing inhibitor BofA family protein [Clostridia bacterium]|nr:pro-sigmaK processing inhibitor BofA family protein [Clostridia bacterium]